MKKKIFQKTVFGLLTLGLALLLQTQNVNAAVQRTYYYSFQNLSGIGLNHILDSDANNNMSNVPSIIRAGGGPFSLSVDGNGVYTIWGDFAGYTPYWRVTASPRKGYTFRGIYETSPAGTFAMYSYLVNGDPYVRDVDAGIWYGDWLNHSDDWNNQNATRANGTHSVIYASYEANTYSYYFYDGGGYAGDAAETFDSSIGAVGVPAAKSNTVYFDTTGGNGIAPQSVNHTFNGWYDDSNTQHFNNQGSAVFSTYTWDYSINLHASWTYNSIQLPTPTRTGYAFGGWYLNGAYVGTGGDWYQVTSDVTLTANWIDNVAPTGGISATPTSWSNANGNVWISANDTGSGLNAIYLYRRTNTDGNYVLVQSWGEPEGVYAKSYNYIEGAQGIFQYRAVVYDRWNNYVILDSNWVYIDKSPPEVTISATPATWANCNGVVTIKTNDNASGIRTVNLYRKATSGGAYVLVRTWTPNAISANLTYTETGENNFQYRVIVTDIAGNSKTADSNWIYIDRTAPASSGTTISALGELDNPVAKTWNTDGTVNSESFGLSLNVKSSDLISGKTVSKIKYAYLRVYQRGNPSNQKYYDLNQSTTNNIPSENGLNSIPVLTAVANGSYSVVNNASFNRNVIIDTTRDFNGVLDLAYEIHIVDYAGNDAYNNHSNLRGSSDREAKIFATIERLTEDSELTNITSFKGGYQGILKITTTGWVDQVDIKWPEAIHKARLEDISLNQAVMNYDALVNMTPGSDATVDVNGIPMNGKNIISSPDTHNTTFTRTYYYYFWIPLYMERSDNIEDVKGYLVDLETRRNYAYPQVNNGVATTNVTFSVGNGNVFEKFRASILY